MAEDFTVKLMKDGRKIGISLHDIHVRNYNISKLAITCTFQVNRIASLFRLHPATVYLSNVKKHNETAIFPGPSGSFSSQVESGSTMKWWVTLHLVVFRLVLVHLEHSPP